MPDMLLDFASPICLLVKTSMQRDSARVAGHRMPAAVVYPPHPCPRPSWFLKQENHLPTSSTTVGLLCKSQQPLLQTSAGKKPTNTIVYAQLFVDAWAHMSTDTHTHTQRQRQPNGTCLCRSLKAHLRTCSKRLIPHTLTGVFGFLCAMYKFSQAEADAERPRTGTGQRNPGEGLGVQPLAKIQRRGIVLLPLCGWQARRKPATQLQVYPHALGRRG